VLVSSAFGQRCKRVGWNSLITRPEIGTPFVRDDRRSNAVGCRTITADLGLI